MGQEFGGRGLFEHHQSWSTTGLQGIFSGQVLHGGQMFAMKDGHISDIGRRRWWRWISIAGLLVVLLLLLLLV